MRTTDKVLLGIVVGALLLAGGAFVLVLIRPEPTYGAEDSPEGVAHNYLLALQREDYSRAYGYLSPNLPGYPTSAQEFERQMEDSFHLQGINELSFTVGTAVIDGSQATVEFLETVFYDGGPLDPGQYTNTFQMDLEQIGAEWRIADSQRYMLDCWKSFGEC